VEWLTAYVRMIAEELNINTDFDRKLGNDSAP
jgi:hypothetical protein